jgi:hypothetical protein
MEDCQQSSDAEKQRKRRAPGKWRPYQSNRPKRTFKEDPQNICFSSAKSTVNGIRMQQISLDHFRAMTMLLKQQKLLYLPLIHPEE